MFLLVQLLLPAAVPMFPATLQLPPNVLVLEDFA